MTGCLNTNEFTETVATRPRVGGHRMFNARHIARADGDQTALVGVAFHRHDAAAGDVVAIHQHEAAGERRVHELVHRQHAVGDRLAVVALQEGQRLGKDSGRGGDVVHGQVIAAGGKAVAVGGNVADPDAAKTIIAEAVKAPKVTVVQRIRNLIRPRAKLTYWLADEEVIVYVSAFHQKDKFKLLYTEIETGRQVMVNSAQPINYRLEELKAGESIQATEIQQNQHY